MPRRCTICIHDERDAINKALITSETFRTIAHLFACSEDALKRHKRDHLPVALANAREVQETVVADGLLDQVRSLQTRALSILGKAEAAGDLRTALVAIRETRGAVELLAKLLGELKDQTVIVILNPVIEEIVALFSQVNQVEGQDERKREFALGADRIIETRLMEAR